MKMTDSMMCIPSIRACRNGYGHSLRSNPDDCWLKGSSEDGSETYIIKKGRLSLNLRPPYSKDRIHKATERIIEEQKEQSKDS